MYTVREEALIQLLQSKLSRDRMTSGGTIYVGIENGELVLVGVCDNEQQRAAAIRIVTGTYGIGRVIDRLRVRRLAQSI